MPRFSDFHDIATKLQRLNKRARETWIIGYTAFCKTTILFSAIINSIVSAVKERQISTQQFWVMIPLNIALTCSFCWRIAAWKKKETLELLMNNSALDYRWESEPLIIRISYDREMKVIILHRLHSNYKWSKQNDTSWRVRWNCRKLPFFFFFFFDF